MGIIDAVANPLEWMVEMIMLSMFLALRSLIDFLLVNTEPQLINTNGGSMADAFQSQFAINVRLGLIITVPVVICATINSLLKGGMRSLLHTYLIGLPVSLLGGVAALTLAALAQAVNENIVDFFDESATANMFEYLANIESFSEAASEYLGMSIVGGIFAIAIILGVLAMTLELLAREITIYMSMLFIPLAFAAYTWSVTRKWLYTMIELVLVMIFSKAVMVAVLSLGFAAVIDLFGNGADSITSELGGLALGGMLLFAGAFTLPALVALVLAPGAGVPLDRQQVQQSNPWNSNRQYFRSVYRTTTTGAIAKATGRGGRGQLNTGG